MRRYSSHGMCLAPQPILAPGRGLNGAIASKRVTYDFARLMQGATEIKCSEFGDNIIAHM